MDHIRTALCVFVFGSFACSQTTQSLSPNAKASDEQKLIALDRARATALAAGDCRGWAKYVDRDFRVLEGGGGGNRDSTIKECEAGHDSPAGHRQERVLSDFHVQWIDSTPIVDCKYQTIEHFGSVSLTEDVLQVSTFRRRGDTWVAVLSVNAAIPHDPPAARTDHSALDGLTGQYGWEGASGVVDSITRTNDKLYVRTTGDAKATELIPIGADTFFLGGSFADRLTFIRDASGKVIVEDVRGPDGQGYRATKIN